MTRVALGMSRYGYGVKFPGIRWRYYNSVSLHDAMRSVAHLVEQAQKPYSGHDWEGIEKVCVTALDGKNNSRFVWKVVRLDDVR